MREWGIAALFSPRHWMEVSDQIHAPATLAPGKEPSVPLESGMGGPQGLSWLYGGEKNLLPLLGMESGPSRK
jgi:hypothetical protein